MIFFYNLSLKGDHLIFRINFIFNIPNTGWVVNVLHLHNASEVEDSQCALKPWIG